MDDYENDHDAVNLDGESGFMESIRAPQIASDKEMKEVREPKSLEFGNSNAILLESTLI
jgi:hypothetical protein